MKKFKNFGIKRPGVWLVLLVLASFTLTSDPLLAEYTLSDNPVNQPSTLISPSETSLTTGTNYLMVLRSDFKPATSSSSYKITNYYGINATNSPADFIASLTLPESAKITEVEASLYHHNGLLSILSLERVDPAVLTNGSTTEGTLAYFSDNLGVQTLKMNGLNVPKLDSSLSKFILVWSPATAGGK